MTICAILKISNVIQKGVLFANFSTPPYLPFIRGSIELSFQITPDTANNDKSNKPSPFKSKFSSKNVRVHQAVHYIVSPILNPEFRFVLEFLGQQE